jgi:shikimate kinase
MGAGKTTLGRQVADTLVVPFVDTDENIVTASQRSVQQVFDEDGEASFRELEARVLRSTSQMEKALIATGGGLPVYHNNMEWLLEHGVTMYLEWPEEVLLASVVQHRSIRPLLSSLSIEEAIRKAKDLLDERSAVYQRAAMTLRLCGEEEKDLQTVLKACRYIW